MSFPYAEANAGSYQRLKATIQRLTDTDLALSTDYGWTISALLAHLAFWDQRMYVILDRWQQNGFDPSPIDSMAVNDSLKIICHALAPRTAASLALIAAERIDAKLATLTLEFVEQIEDYAEANSIQFRMNRALHRNAHLDDIELLFQQGR
jgi:hypothetical protein